MNIVNLILLLTCAATVGWCLKVKSRTESNQNQPASMIDADPGTCFRTGSGYQEWLLVDLEQSVAIKGVKLYGNWNFMNIRVGDQVDDLGNGTGFETNSLCKTVEPADPGKAMAVNREVICEGVVTGRYLSLQLVDPSIATFIRICDLVPIYG